MDQIADLLDIGKAVRPMVGSMAQCGDLAYLNLTGSKLHGALLDVLGHGPEAREVALTAEACLARDSWSDLLELMEVLHRNLFRTRGAVGVLFTIDAAGQTLNCTGIGNISLQISGTEPYRAVFRDGIIGFGRVKPVICSRKFVPGDSLIIVSDGVKSCREVVAAGVGNLQGMAQDLADRIIRSYSRDNDDAACIVCSFRQPTVPEFRRPGSGSIGEECG